jgi:hypothetical protein
VGGYAASATAPGTWTGVLVCRAGRAGVSIQLPSTIQEASFTKVKVTSTLGYRVELFVIPVGSGLARWFRGPAQRPPPGP